MASSLSTYASGCTRIPRSLRFMLARRSAETM